PLAIAGGGYWARRRLAGHERPHAGGVGVERAGMADALEAEPATHQRDRVERGHARRLVEHEDPGAGHRGSDSRTAVRTSRVTASSEPAAVKPAALGCPPPPKRAAIRWTSTSPLPRRLTFTWVPRSRR